MFDRFGSQFHKVASVMAIAAVCSIVPHSGAQAQSGSPSTTPAPAASPKPVNTRNLTVTQLLQQASGAGQFKTLAAAIKAAGVGNAIGKGQKVTIFAPTDAAFAALPAGAVEELVKPANRALLARILAYHVVAGEVTSKQLKSGSLRTLGGGVSVNVSASRVIVNDASVVQADLLASNGVIHAVNRILMPREIRSQLGLLLQN